MSEKTKQIEDLPFRVDLDSEIRTMSGRCLRSLLGLFAHLENLGMCQKQYSHSIPPRNRASKSQVVSAQSQQTAPTRLKRPCFRELGRRVLGAAKSQVQVLQVRIEEIQFLVLINDWSAADQLWSEFLPDCRTPLFMLSFLEELWEINPGQLKSNSHALARHWHQFILIQAEVENLLSHRQSRLELSNALELHLGAWLEGFGKLLEKLDEDSIA
jgi:hypothetical protein